MVYSRSEGCMDIIYPKLLQHVDPYYIHIAHSSLQMLYIAVYVSGFTHPLGNTTQNASVYSIYYISQC